MKIHLLAGPWDGQTRDVPLAAKCLLLAGEDGRYVLAGVKSVSDETLVYRWEER